MKKKQCSKCTEWKSTDEFYKQKKSTKKQGVFYRLQAMCKSCTIEIRKQYREENYEKVTGQKKRYFEANKEKEYQIVREWRQKNKDRNKEYFYEYKKNNPDKFKEYQQVRLNKDHKISKTEWNKCKEYFRNSCAYCGLHIDDHYITYAGEPRHTDLHKEHAFHDGSSDLSNCVPACKSCNVKKNTYSYIEWFNLNFKPIEYTEERFKLIQKWLKKDYKNHIEI